MGKEIEKVYNECEGCKENSRSKPNIPGKMNDVTPSSLETGCAGELLSTDFGQYGKNLMPRIQNSRFLLTSDHITTPL